MNWEVRTMRSARSWFNVTLFQKNMTRFWPIWGLYLVIWLFLLPVNLILGNSPALYFAQRVVLGTIPYVGLGMSVVFALLAACAVWSYLYNSRSACLMHSLPIRREGLFLTNFLSGMAFFVGPNLVVFLLTLLAEAAKGRVNVGALVMWLFSVTLMELFFFCFATFCAMFTGHILALPAFYAILNVLVVGLVWLLDLTLSRFVFGYTGIAGLWRAAEWLTPVWKLEGYLEVRQITEIGAEVETYRFVGLGYILIYVFFGLVLAAVALAVYRRRDMERAGDVVTVAPMRPVFQYGVAFCCALAFGSLLYEIFNSTLPEGAWTLLVFMLLCGAAGYFVARMLLEKSFRVFHCWKGCVPFLAALVVLVCVMEFDLTGFERRVPDEDAVASVEIWGIDTKPYDTANYGATVSADPEVIRAVLAAHRTIAENKDAIEAVQRDGIGAWWTEDEAEYSVQTRGYSSFWVIYTMEDGGMVERNYSIPVFTSELNDPDSVTAKLDTLINLPQVVGDLYGLSGKSADDLVQVTLSDYDHNSVEVDHDAYTRVFEAVLADLEEGGLGRRYLMDDEERMNNCFVNDLEFTFYYNASGVTARSAEETAPTTRSITVTLQTTAKHTLAVLEELGVLESPVRLVTKAQNEMSDMSWEEKEESGAGVDLDDYTWAVLGK